LPSSSLAFEVVQEFDINHALEGFIWITVALKKLSHHHKGD